MSNVTEDEKFQQLQAGIAKIKQKFIATLPERVEEFDSLLDRLYEDEDNAEVVSEIGKKAHKLHGLAGSFGFGTIGKMAAKLEHEVMAVEAAGEPMDTECVEAYLVAMLDEIDSCLKAA